MLYSNYAVYAKKDHQNMLQGPFLLQCEITFFSYYRQTIYIGRRVRVAADPEPFVPTVRLQNIGFGKLA
jgi:hypothetical protein